MKKLIKLKCKDICHLKYHVVLNIIITVEKYKLKLIK